jgi:hypothetical protein
MSGGGKKHEAEDQKTRRRKHPLRGDDVDKARMQLQSQVLVQSFISSIGKHRLLSPLAHDAVRTVEKHRPCGILVVSRRIT